MQRRTTLFITLAALTLPACAIEDDEDVMLRTGHDTGGNTGGGTVFNTHEIDDARLSELAQPLGQRRLGLALQSVTAAKTHAITSFEVDPNGLLVGYDEFGDSFKDEDMVGSEWVLASDFLILPGTAMRLAETRDIKGVKHYRFTHETPDGWVNNCPSGGIHATKDQGFARLLTGFTLDEDHGTVEAAENNTYIACSTGATGKAAAWGYYDLAVELRDWEPFENAIRVIRADYCYDGDAHTKNGIELYIEDRWGALQPNDDDPLSLRPVEAVWGPDGLLCRGKARLDAVLPTICAEKEIPQCDENVTLETFPEAQFLTRA